MHAVAGVLGRARPGAARCRLLGLAAACLAAACFAPGPAAQQSRAFTAGTRIPAGRAPGSVALADLDGDGRLDLLVANEGSHDLTVLLGDGGGGFTSAPGSPVAAGHMPNDIALGRFDGDGTLDVAVANHDANHLTVLLGDGSGRLRQAPGSPIPVRVRPHPHGIAAADFDGDGNLDLVTDGWETDEVEILRGDGRGGFTPLATVRVGRHPYQRVRAWDVNRDGHADILTANLRGVDVTVLLGDGRGGFREAPGSPVPCAPFPTALALGDFDGDGHRDLAVASSPSNSGGSGRDGLTLLLGDGAGGFRAVEPMPTATGAAPTQLAVGDLDGDGRDEIAVSNMNSGTVSVARLGAGGRVVPVEVVPVGRLPKGIATGDLNGDGKLDLAVANNGDDDVSILLSR